MKKFVIAVCVAGLAACGGQQNASDDQPTEEPKEEVVATTDAPAEEPAEAEPADPNALPAPPNVDAAPPTADTSPSGLAWIVLSAGDGAGSPTPESTIKVHYTGWTTDGTMFDSSVARGEPIEFPLSKLIPGWIEGIPMMSKGEKRRFWIPAELAYGNSTRPDAPKGLLVFDIELLDFQN